jgi:hypothetical protein
VFLSELRPRRLVHGVAEVAIVVLSILIAFGLDSWWDTRTAARWERIELESLRDEFAANLEHLAQVIRTHEESVVAVEAIRDFAADGSSDSTVLFPDSVLAFLIEWRTSEITMGTLDALLASGDLGELRSPELRRRLAGWKALVLDAQEKEILARDFIEFVLTPALVGNSVLTPAYAARRPYGRPSVSVNVEPSAELRDLSSARLAHLRLAIVSQTRVRAEVINILTVLEEELGTR